MAAEKRGMARPVGRLRGHTGRAGKAGMPGRGGRSANRLWARLMALGGATGCHQRADRSFFWRGKYQLPLCARCTGAFLGGLCALALGLVAKPRVWHGALLAPTALDGITQAAGYRESTNLLRLVTGWFAGFGYISMLLAGLAALARLFRPRRG